jgi:23S rRNA (adenine2030-N6)-methyltransferase
MPAKRHAFHAGTHADVLKHLILVQVLQYMGGKDKPYTLLDTHAGAGRCSLKGQHGAHHTGIGRLEQQKDPPAAVADYLQQVRNFNAGGRLAQYPGSPGLARQLLRSDDRLRLYELHPPDYRSLQSFVGQRPNTQVFMADGFTALKGELPPPSRRGVVLIDPSYDVKSDCTRVLAAVREGLQRFAEAVLLVWVPQLQQVEVAQLPHRLQAAAEMAPKGWLHARLTVVQGAGRAAPLAGSSVFVVNPPHVLHDRLKDALPWLTEALGQYDGAHYLLEHQAR